MGTASIAPEGGIRPEPDMGSILPPKNDTSQWVNSALFNAAMPAQKTFLTNPLVSQAPCRPKR